MIGQAILRFCFVCISRVVCDRGRVCSELIYDNLTGGRIYLIFRLRRGFLIRFGNDIFDRSGYRACGISIWLRDGRCIRTRMVGKTVLIKLQVSILLVLRVQPRSFVYDDRRIVTSCLLIVQGQGGGMGMAVIYRVLGIEGGRQGLAAAGADPQEGFSIRAYFV